MESVGLITLITFGLVIVLLASGMWISVALGTMGVILLFFVGGRAPNLIPVLQFNTTNIFTYTAIPLFIFMGEIIFFSGIGDKLYRGATPWVSFLPGGLLHTNILACAIFAAISGSSMTGAATLGTVAAPELLRRGYSPRLALGSIAAGGTLGILIPPSLGFIIYGSFVNESIAQLFMAGVFPGIALSGLFMLYIGIASVINPRLAPERFRPSPKAMALGLLDVWPVFVLIFAVLGTLYLGVATPTEAAALGGFMSLVFCVAYRRLTWPAIKQAALGSLKITSWVMLIVIGAMILGTGLSLLDVPAQLADWVASLEVNRMVILFFIAILYIVLGMFIDSTSMLLLTLPVVYPIMMALGFNGVWFGVMMVLFMEMAQITPPVGINLYVVHGVTGQRYLADIIRGCIPFVFCMAAMLVILAAFPSVATWLPSQMIQRR